MVSGPLPTEAPSPIRRACLALLLIVAAVLAWNAGGQLAVAAPDFEYFYKAGAWWLAHGGLDRGYDLLPAGQLVPRGSIEWYLPAVSRFFTLLAWLPFPVAGALWLALNLALMLATLRMLGRHVCGLPPRDWAVTMLVPFLLLIVFWRWEFYLNQVNALTLALVVTGFVQWQRQRSALAGFFTGLATLLKLTPGLLILWYLLKRDLRAAGVALAVVLGFGLAGDVLIWGPRDAAAAYQGWLRAAVVDGSHRQLILTDRELDWRNQGLGAILARWLTPANYALRFDNDPRLTHTEPPALMNVSTWSRPAVAALATSLSAALLALFVWFARHPASRLTLWQLRSEWAVALLLMLALMPVLRRYHFIGILPALAVLAGAVHFHGLRHGWSWCALGCLLLAVATQLTMLERSWEATGLLWTSLLLIAVPLVLLHQRSARTGRATQQSEPLVKSAGRLPASVAHPQPQVSHA